MQPSESYRDVGAKKKDSSLSKEAVTTIKSRAYYLMTDGRSVRSGSKKILRINRNGTKMHRFGLVLLLPKERKSQEHDEVSSVQAMQARSEVKCFHCSRFGHIRKQCSDKPEADKGKQQKKLGQMLMPLSPWLSQEDDILDFC